MRNKRRSRAVEWGKDLLILLLACSALYLLSRTQFSGQIRDGVQGLLNRGSGSGEEISASRTQLELNHPIRLAVSHEGQRYGVQYDREGVDETFSALSILFSEALSSADEPETVTETAWRAALSSTGIYLDFYDPIPVSVLYGWLAPEQEQPAMEGSIRRMCLAARSSGEIWLYYINEADGGFYACGTTLTQDLHLDEAVENWPPNGAQFAFEVESMAALEPYTLLTDISDPAVYAAANPLLTERTRVDALLDALQFPTHGATLDPLTGGRLVDQNDSLRLSSDGVVVFHTMGGTETRFSVGERTLAAAVEYVQTLAQSTVGAWCGDARLCLADVEEFTDGWKITFQYSLNATPVTLAEGRAAAAFTVENGAVTDFTLVPRAYTRTEETSLILPAVQAAAAMEALDAQGKELVLAYQDAGADEVRAGWMAS